MRNPDAKAARTGLSHPGSLFDQDLALASLDHGSPHAIVWVF
jgi:hypothetical protein